jgi:hypothetical protein
MVVDVLGTESVDSDLGWMDGLDSPGALHCRKMLIGKTAREQRSNVGCQQGVRWEGCGKGCGKGDAPTASSRSIWSSMSSAKNKLLQPPPRKASRPLTLPMPANPQQPTTGAHGSVSALSEVESRGVRGVRASRPWP